VARAPSFDTERFEGLVLFIAHSRKDDPAFGRTKLAKVLFYSDFDAFRDQGTPLTGAHYIRMPFGPFPAELEATERSLERDGFVALDYAKGEYEEKKIIPRTDGDYERAAVRLFDPWELKLVSNWMEHIAAASAREISRLSHHHPGWILAGDTGKPIPYETAMLPQEKPTAESAERAKELARERGWLTDSGFIWERDPA
jgi:hypothetical protein